MSVIIKQEGEWESKKNLKGSESRDDFKHMHKKLDKTFWATDLDLVLVDKYPPGIVAVIDYKKPSDSVSFTEAILYNLLITTAPVFIVEAINPYVGPYTIKVYKWGSWKEFPPRIEYREVIQLADRDAYEEWERMLRSEYRRTHR